MWFLIGLAVAAVCAGLVGSARKPVRWQGWSQHSSGLQVTELHSKQKLHQVSVGLPLASGLDFSAYRQGWLNRLAQHLGLVRKLDTGDVSFDDAVFVAGDDPKLLAALRSDSVLREVLLTLVQGPPDSFRLVRIVCRAGAVHAIWRPRLLSTATATANDIAHWCEPTLHYLADYLPNGSYAGGRDPQAARARWPLAVAAALLGNAGVGLVRMLVGEPMLLLDSPSWPLFAAAVAGLLALPVLVATLVLAGSTRLPRVLAPVLLIGVLGALGSASFLLRDANVLLDFGDPVKRTVAARVGPPAYGFLSHRLEIDPVVVSGGSLRVSWEMALRMQSRSSATLTLHPGALGLRWVSEIEPGPLPPIRRR